MMDTLACILYLYPHLVPGPDFTIRSNAIATWSAAEAQPTVDQLSSAWEAMQFASTQAVQLTMIDTAYQSAITAPVSYMGTSFAADPASQQIFAHAMVVYGALGSVPSDFYCVDVNYAKVAMTLAQLQGLGAAIAAVYLPAFQRYIDLKTQILNATTVASVQAIHW